MSYWDYEYWKHPDSGHCKPSGDDIVGQQWPVLPVAESWPLVASLFTNQQYQDHCQGEQ